MPIFSRRSTILVLAGLFIVLLAANYFFHSLVSAQQAYWAERGFTSSRWLPVDSKYIQSTSFVKEMAGMVFSFNQTSDSSGFDIEIWDPVKKVNEKLRIPANSRGVFFAVDANGNLVPQSYQQTLQNIRKDSLVSIKYTTDSSGNLLQVRNFTMEEASLGTEPYDPTED